MINNISLDYLKIYYEVVKQGGVSQAAKTLLLSQPAITQTLNKLEQGLECQLLQRNNKGIVVTPLGKQVYTQVGNIMATLKAIDTLVTEDSNLLSGRIVIGCGTNIAKKLLIEPIMKFSKQHPNIMFSVFDDSQKKFIEKINNGEMDVCIIQKSTYIPSHMHFVKLIDESFKFVASPILLRQNANPFLHKFILQQQQNFSRSLFDAYCKKSGIEALNVIEVVGYNLTTELALKGVGIGMAPNYLVEDYIKKGQLTELNIQLDNPVMEYGYCFNPQFVTKALAQFLPYLS